MGYDPWGRKESNMTEATEHSLEGNIKAVMNIFFNPL